MLQSLTFGFCMQLGLEMSNMCSSKVQKLIIIRPLVLLPLPHHPQPHRGSCHTCLGWGVVTSKRMLEELCAHSKLGALGPPQNPNAKTTRRETLSHVVHSACPLTDMELQLGELDRVRKLYQKWLQYNPTNTQVWVKYATLEDGLEERERARCAWGPRRDSNCQPLKFTPVSAASTGTYSRWQCGSPRWTCRRCAGKRSSISRSATKSTPGPGVAAYGDVRPVLIAIVFSCDIKLWWS